MTPDQVTDWILYAVAFGLAMAVVNWVTPLTMRLATTFKIHDAPDGRLKKHTQPTPYLGGLAVAAGFVVAFSLLSREQVPGSSSLDLRGGLGILASGFMMVMLGLYDDLLNLRPSVKFLGQFLAAVVLYKAGVRIDLAALPAWVNLTLTIVWVTGITNAFNIIDVMDGLATGTAAIAALALFTISVTLMTDSVVPFMAITLAGALFGFLKYNFAPARIFLGDTGSLFIGFMIGALSMMVSYSDRRPLVAIAAPILILGIPIFDTLFVAWHRARQGIPFFRGSPDHFALRMAHAQGPVRRVVLRVYRTAILLAGVALLIVFGPDAAVPWALLAVALAAIVMARRLSSLPVPEA